MKKELKNPSETIKSFGKVYVYQGTFDDAGVMEATKRNWSNAGHSTMIKKGNILYATQLKTRSY